MKNRPKTSNPPYPALLVDSLTPAYDLFARLFIPEMRLKEALIANARLAPGQRVLDLGAGTGTLAMMIKRSQPDVQVIGLDGDQKILAVARQKAARYGLNVVFIPGNVIDLPYSSRTFDRVFSTLVLSLLNGEQKAQAVGEAYRILKSSGELHIADFGPPHTWWGRAVSPRVRRFEPIAGNLDGLLPALFREAGFQKVKETSHFATLFGTISILTGQKR